MYIDVNQTAVGTAFYLSAAGLLLAALAPLDEQLPVEDVDQEVHHDVGQQLLQQHAARSVQHQQFVRS